MGRIIVFTGKGGVGKSSVAAANALKSARLGRKTLVVSTDMAHNLADIYQKPISEEPFEIEENLYGLEIDPNHELDNSYGHISETIEKLVSSFGEEKEDLLESMVMVPGIEELFSLIKIKRLYDEGNYELIVVDCAPTGETLSLLKFPELLSWYMEKLFPIGKIAMKVLRPISKIAFKIEMPDSKAMNDIQRLYLELQELQKLLKNRDVCSVRIVTIPEKMVVEESKRNYMYLNLYNFNVDGIYINRIIPNEVENNFFDEWKVVQEKYLKEIQAVFMDVPTFKIKWYETDINGIKGLERIVEDSLNNNDIFKVLKKIDNETFEKIEEGYKLMVFVPFADKSDFELFQSTTEVIIKLGNYKRNIPLPDVLRSYSITSAKLENKKLEIIFR